MLIKRANCHCRRPKPTELCTVNADARAHAHAATCMSFRSLTHSIKADNARPLCGLFESTLTVRHPIPRKFPSPSIQKCEPSSTALPSKILVLISKPYRHKIRGREFMFVCHAFQYTPYPEIGINPFSLCPPNSMYKLCWASDAEW